MQQVVLVCGGRDYADVDRVYLILDATHRANPIMRLIHGKATGADSIAEMWADQNGVPPVGYEADWNNLETPPVVIRMRKDGTYYNAAAGGTRNQRMLDEGKPHMVIAFPGGRGTADMVKRAEQAGVPVVRVRPRATAKPDPEDDYADRAEQKARR